jgi:hypothetical protein
MMVASVMVGLEPVLKMRHQGIGVAGDMDDLATVFRAGGDGQGGLRQAPCLGEEFDQGDVRLAVFRGCRTRACSAAPPSPAGATPSSRFADAFGVSRTATATPSCRVVTGSAAMIAIR